MKSTRKGFGGGRGADCWDAVDGRVEERIVNVREKVEVRMDQEVKQITYESPLNNKTPHQKFLSFRQTKRLTKANIKGSAQSFWNLQ